MEKPKIKIYIDGANMFYTQKRLGWSIDWEKVKKYIEQEKFENIKDKIFRE